MKRVVENAIDSRNFRQAVTWTLFACIILSAILYAYWVNSAIINVVEARRSNFRISALGSDLNGLQEKYLSMQNQTTLIRAVSMGFSQSEDTKFISRKPLGKALSLIEEI